MEKFLERNKSPKLTEEEETDNLNKQNWKWKDPDTTPWTVACQPPLFMGFSRQEYCSGLPLPFPGDLPDPGIKLVSPVSAGRFFTVAPSGKPSGATKKVKSLSRVRLFATPLTVAHQAPPSVEFSRQEYWSGLPFPSPGDLPDGGLNPGLQYCGQTLYHLSHQGIP